MKTEATRKDGEGRVLEHATTLAPDPASSVEISENSRGQAQVTVKVHHEDPKKAATLALQVYKDVCKRLNRKES